MSRKMGSCAGEKRGERMGKVGREIREGEMEEMEERRKGVKERGRK